MAYTDGADAAALISDLGMVLFPWQRGIVDEWAAKQADNTPAYITCGLDVPRQNGKNAALEAYEVMVLAVYGWHVLHTAHRVKTTKKAFYRLVKYFTDKRHPELSGMVESIRRTNGEEAINLSNGGSIEFASRTTGSARGYDDIQLVVYDEAQELTDSQFQSIDFAMSASTTDGGARQKIFTGTPPYEGCNGTVFARQRSAALNVTPSRTTWSSWACPEAPRKGARWEDVVGEVYACNPSMGALLDIEYTETEFAGSTPLAFAQERLDWWSPQATRDHPIDRARWAELEIPAIADEFTGRSALAVKLAPDGSQAALCGCKLSTDGSRAALELVDVLDLAGGTRALAEWLFARRSKHAAVAIDGLGAADALCANLAALKPPRGYVVRPSASDVVSAASTLCDAVRDGTALHTPNDDLDASATDAVRRKIGSRGGWGFGAGELAPSMPIEAAALALWAARNAKRDPNRKGGFA